MIQFVHNFYSSYNQIQNISMCELTFTITKQTFCNRGRIISFKNEEGGKGLPHKNARFI